MTIMNPPNKIQSPMTVDFRMKSIPPIVWFVPALLLLIAVWRLPYGYYTFTRILTCGIALVIAVASVSERPAIQVSSIPLLAIVVLFNPLVPIHLYRATWLYFDLACAAIFILHLVCVRLKVS